MDKYIVNKIVKERHNSIFVTLAHSFARLLVADVHISACQRMRT